MVMDILNAYYADNAKKLHRTVGRILIQFGGLSNKDMDDFYSLANEVFVDVMKRYDDSQSFDGFLYACLSNKIMSEITKGNCQKRRADRMAVSFETVIGDSDGLTIGDIIADSFDMERELFGEINALTFKLEKYLAMLSRKQRAEGSAGTIIILLQSGGNSEDVTYKSERIRGHIREYPFL